jgi:hypothetical protein
MKILVEVLERNEEFPERKFKISTLDDESRSYDWEYAETREKAAEVLTNLLEIA